jgi:hypothetical protein
MVPSTVRTALVTRLNTITGLRAYDTVPDVITPPCAVVDQLLLTFDTANARGLDTATVDVLLIVDRMDSASGQKALDGFLASTGPGSVKTAIEADRTLGGAVSTLKVVSAAPGQYESQAIVFLAYRYSLVIYG